MIHLNFTVAIFVQVAGAFCCSPDSDSFVALSLSVQLGTVEENGCAYLQSPNELNGKTTCPLVASCRCIVAEPLRFAKAVIPFITDRSERVFYK